MTHLIKLELKKFGIAQNIIFMFAAILFSILFITISLWDSMTDPKQVKDTFESTYLVIGLLIMEVDFCPALCIPKVAVLQAFWGISHFVWYCKAVSDLS